ncbi:MAG: DUF2490 domain-containing protein [Saprospiraceae bacterium]|nr:DUF2490 domain-containing protein [Saprospiraceae bacterium]
MIRQILHILFVVSCAFQLVAQSSNELGLMSYVNVNKKFEKDWNLNLKIGNRQSLVRDLFGEYPQRGLENIRTDFSLFATQSIIFNQRIALGYITIIGDGETQHRLIQQYALVSKFDDFSLSQRVSVNQIWKKDEDLRFRLRYRIASSIPLNGQTINPSEFYLKVSNEFVNSWQGDTYDLEIRLAPFVGYGISKMHKVEIGLDYRINSFLVDSPTNRLWINLNWYVSL